MNKFPLMLILSALFFTQPAHALRCGTKLVNEGDPKIRVIKNCGDPDYVQERVIYRSGPTRNRIRSDTNDSNSYIREEVLFYQRSLVEVLVEEWTYNFGPLRLMRVIRFENGYVVDVDTIGYGYTE